MKILKNTIRCRQLSLALKKWKNLAANLPQSFQEIEKVQEIEEKNRLMQAVLMRSQKLILKINACNNALSEYSFLFFKEAMGRHFDKASEILKMYQMVQEDPLLPGQFFYENSYDPQHIESVPCSQYQKGKKYYMPSKDKVLTSLNKQHWQLFNQMLKEGLEPQLQITPLDSLAMLIQKANLVREDGFRLDFVENKDFFIIYEPTALQLSDQGKSLEVSGGVLKSRFIENNKGYLVSIVAAKPLLDEPADISAELTNAQKTVVLMTSAWREGYCGMGFEDYLVANLVKSTLLDIQHWSVLAETAVRAFYSNIVPRGHHNFQYVKLQNCLARESSNSFRFRKSIRIPWSKKSFK